jgi:hypothetical protein
MVCTIKDFIVPDTILVDWDLYIVIFLLDLDEHKRSIVLYPFILLFKRRQPNVFI